MRVHLDDEVRPQHIHEGQHGRGQGCVFATHLGLFHDDVDFLRTITMKEINSSPSYMLVDSLATFKVIKGMNEHANLHNLMTR